MIIKYYCKITTLQLKENVVLNIKETVAFVTWFSIETRSFLTFTYIDKVPIGPKMISAEIETNVNH